MVIKKGYYKIGAVKKVNAVYNAGVIDFYYNNGSGISKKTLDLSSGELSGGTGTGMLYDRAAVTRLKTIGIKGSEMICY